VTLNVPNAITVNDRREEGMDSTAGTGNRPAVVVGATIHPGGEPSLPGGERPAPANTCHPAESLRGQVNAHRGPPALLTPAITSRAERSLAVASGIGQLEPRD